ncbi:MAG: hypothetical protein MUF51_10715, partial [Vicinamibacteria bacterium]|nr:hypothetical protein [Vicinamibacteria bacterium]
MLRIAIVHPGQDPREFTHPEGPLEFGRGEGAPPHPRCRIPDKYVSKDHLRVCEIAGGQVVIENLSQTNAARIGMTSLGVSERQEFALPVKIVLGETTIELSVFVEEQEDDTVGAASIAGAILKTIKRSVVMNSLTKSEPFLSLRGDMTPERLLTWFE